VGDRSVDLPSIRVERDLVDIAPAPVLARLERSHDRVAGQPEMGGRVLVLGAVATTDVTTYHAQPQMDPRIADPQAVLAAVRAGRDHLDLNEVRTCNHRLYRAYDAWLT
jgi:hypothetical protein